MILLPKYNAIILQPIKCATTSVDQLLLAKPYDGIQHSGYCGSSDAGKHTPYIVIQCLKHFDCSPESIKVGVLVRNPYNRVESLYRYSNFPDTFHNYVCDVVNREGSRYERHDAWRVWPVRKWADPAYAGAMGKQRPVAIRVEDLGFNLLKFFADCPNFLESTSPFVMPHANVSKPREIVWTQEAREIVNKQHKRDFVAYGYQRIDPTKGE